MGPREGEGVVKVRALVETCLIAAVVVISCYLGCALLATLY